MLILAPNKSYTGESFGVMFQHGVGHTDDSWLLARFKEKGFAIQAEPKTAEEMLKAQIKDLEAQVADLTAQLEAVKSTDMSRDEIKAALTEKGVDFKGNASKEDLKKLLEDSK
ncbi:hypothetical protein [Enterococcus dispar]|uniref:hypothetical protein n=1 Tax=Enterococcus dispar TaxID=44009 RepID=UPI0018A0A821|nr:hypothetical protein [Enterococcus dispar]